MHLTGGQGIHVIASCWQVILDIYQEELHTYVMFYNVLFYEQSVRYSHTTQLPMPKTLIMGYHCLNLRIDLTIQEIHKTGSDPMLG